MDIELTGFFFYPFFRIEIIILPLFDRRIEALSICRFFRLRWCSSPPLVLTFRSGPKKPPEEDVICGKSCLFIQ